jgi:hypothetical protein
MIETSGGAWVMGECNRDESWRAGSTCEILALRQDRQ